MIKFKKNILLFVLIILLCISIYKSQDDEEENMYLKLKKMAQDQTNPDHSIGSDGKKREISNEDKELYSKVPVFPMMNRKFFCDIDIKLDTVKQDVMKNHNYNKYLFFTN